VTVEAPIFSRNTDCIDPDSSRHVLIRNCTLSGGDDNIAIKSGQDAAGRRYARPAYNITVEDVTVLQGDGISIGSEMSGGVSLVRVRRVTMGYVLHPLRIKSGYGRGGTVDDVEFADVRLAGGVGQITGTALVVDEFDGNIPPNATRSRASATPRAPHPPTHSLHLALCWDKRRVQHCSARSPLRLALLPMLHFEVNATLTRARTARL